MMKKTAVVLVVLFFFFGQSSVFAAINRDRQGIAVHGYDVVAYFEQGSPVKGNPNIQVRWNGAKWHFVTESNKQRFNSDPGRYVPQYGGYCAYAVTKGVKADIDPKAWSVVNGKLYLNASPGVQLMWLQNSAANITKGDEVWPLIQ